MAKKIDPAKAKAKRDKIIAAVLGGVLLVACVIAVPMSLKQWKKLNGGGQDASPPAQTTPAPGAVPLAPPDLGADAGIAGTVAAPLATGELRTFDLFESKDPFDQQIDVSDLREPSTPAPGIQAPTRQGSTPSPLTPATPPVTATPKPPQPPPTAAVVSVNGAPPELLGVGIEFPLPPAEPIFKLDSLAPGRARIAIVGGAYASGDATVTLKLGKALTLENTADGTRYELKLLWLGTGPPPPGLVPAPPTAAAPTATPSTPASTP